MTHDSVTNFAASLVEMAKAHAEVPGLHDRITELEQGRVIDGETIARLEKRIIDLKQDQDALYSKLRSVEVERDDASFRLLEAEDRVVVVEHLLRGAQATLGEAIVAVSPPKVEPPLPSASTTSASSEGSSSIPAATPESSEARPTEGGELQANPTVPTGTSSSEAQGDSKAQPEGQGQSADPLPISGAKPDNAGQEHDAKSSDGTVPATPTVEGERAPHPTAPSGTAESPARMQSASISSDAGSPPRPSSSLIGDDEHIDWPAQFNRQFS